MDPDLLPWPGLQLGERILTDSNRSMVWQGMIGAERVAVRQSRRNSASLQWELDLIGDLGANDFVVPAVVPTDDGQMHVEGLVVQRWIDGREPATESDWRLVGAELQRLHVVAQSRNQRPGCCAVTELVQRRVSVDADLDLMPSNAADQVMAVFADFPDVPVSVIHGDPWAPNLRITDNGRVGMLDFDESRVDVVWHDLSNLGVQVLSDVDHARAQRLSNAWEAANGWQVENAYARRRLAALSP